MAYLMQDSLESGQIHEGGMVYAQLNKSSLSKRLPVSDTPCSTGKMVSDDPNGSIHEDRKILQKSDGGIYAQAKKVNSFYTTVKESHPSQLCDPRKSPGLSIVYSEVNVDHGRSLSLASRAHDIYPFPRPEFTPPCNEMKITLKTPPTTPPKLSPKLIAKTKNSVEMGEQELEYSMYQFSMTGYKKLVESVPYDLISNNKPDREYAELNYPKSLAAGASQAGNAYEQIPISWSKTAFQDHNSPKQPRDVSAYTDMTYDHMQPRTSGTPTYTENTYEKISRAENTYEPIPLNFMKGTDMKKHALKNEHWKGFFGRKNKN